MPVRAPVIKTTGSLMGLLLEAGAQLLRRILLHGTLRVDFRLKLARRAG
jgi:hypothetical protein